ncbi:MAG: hypothetical protein KAI17_24155, partial [Thiotrichaceae bacterium]|nr:hypothetical protein [Thiotrichaceae bacterium]
NCYRISNPRLAKKKYKLRFVLLFTTLSLSILFAFSSYSTTNPAAATSLSTAIAGDDKLNNVHTTALELPAIAHHAEPIIEPVPPVELEKEIPDVSIKSVPEKSIQQVVVAEKHATPKPVEMKIDKANINKTLVSIKQKTVADKQTAIIASSPLSTKIESQSKTIIVKKGDNLSLIFKRLSLSASTLYQIINSGKLAKQLQRIKPGQKITIYQADNKFDSLHYAVNSVDTLIINKKNKQYISQIESKEIETRQQFASATIENSLFLSGNKAGLSSAMIMEMAGIFGWDIDFALDVRKGDSFTVLYEEKFIDDKKFSNGHILSAEFINKGKSYTAVRFTDSSGHTDYYSAKGLTMRKAFLRTPVAFSRISSRFSYSRKHPVLNKKLPHKG